MRMQIRMLGGIIDAVKAMRALAIESDELGSRIEDVANELLFEVAQILVDYERTDALRVLHKLYRSDLSYDDFVKTVIDYRRTIIGDEEPDDWEYPYYGMLMLTEPVFTTNEEASDA
jgi:hypothetical protein